MPHYLGEPDPIHPVHLIGYHPSNLCYLMIPDAFDGTHPDDPHGSPEPAVGVHGVTTLLDWEANPHGDVSGALLWHPVTLGQWTASRAEFADLPAGVRAAHAAVGPAANKARGGTHLGLTLAAVTSDAKIVLRARTGRYAEEHLHDSLVAGTMLTRHVSPAGDTWTIDVLRALLFEANISPDRDVAELHPTHLAVRQSDSGLWLGGWMSLGLTAAQVAAAVPFPVVAFGIGSPAPVPVTPWCAYDLDAMAVHHAGGELVHRMWLP